MPMLLKKTTTRDKKTKLIAFSESFGSGIAYSSFNVEITTVMDTIAVKREKTPKSDGEYRRVIIGVESRTII